MFPQLLERLGRREDLTADQAADAMDAVMDGRATAVEMTALLVGLAMKGQRATEIVGLARAMRSHAVKLPAVDRSGKIVDLCGTGGDMSGTFNISSLAAVVVAGCGVKVAKHGNRGVSSSCGSADLLEELGVNLEASPAGVAACLAEAGLGFLFAPAFHPAMRHAAAVRRELKVRTAFNLLGPLTNPAAPDRQIVGVPRPDLTELVARALLLLGSERAWVVHGADGLDELSTTGHSKVSECYAGVVRTFYVHPSDFGIRVAGPAALRGGDPRESAAIARRVLDGEPGPARDIVLLNSGAALFVAGAATSVRDGIEQGAQAIDRGHARLVLERLVRLSGARGHEHTKARRTDSLCHAATEANGAAKATEKA
ncbi:MAG: anthranilate phosphoribosyltransferase [Vicinamibacterales bacterium]